MKVIRKRLGLTQSELAFRLDVHPITLSRFERDAEPITRLVKFALGRLDRQEGQKQWLEDLELQIEGIVNEHPTHVQDNRPLYTRIVRSELDQISRAIQEGYYPANAAHLRRVEATFKRVEKKVAANPQPKRITPGGMIFS